MEAISAELEEGREEQSRFGDSVVNSSSDVISTFSHLVTRTVNS